MTKAGQLDPVRYRALYRRRLLPLLRLVYYDPYAECRNTEHMVGSLSLRVRPLLQGNADRPQLFAPACYAEPGDDLGDCRLYSVVAWDPTSWPGNDFWARARVTDDWGAGPPRAT
ncbi:MAG: hypothetical protein GVY22_03245 [Gammaproteobacteria bacterium]|nr:hypothetical protein [Gammaproteobacteria bacterium]